MTLVLRESTLQRVLLPLVAFAAGSLIGGALLAAHRACASRVPEAWRDCVAVYHCAYLISEMIRELYDSVTLPGCERIHELDRGDDAGVTPRLTAAAPVSLR